ncbi:MAG: carboxylating nicotinate-nucleotide diphosphorylase [Candidatus Zixiibacteriota bacterium]
MSTFGIPRSEYKRRMAALVRMALSEDIGTGDKTTRALRLGDRREAAFIVAKSDGILAGQEVVTATFRALDPRTVITWSVREGSPLRPGLKVAKIHARATAILTGERTALNFLSRLSGVATTTRKFVDAIGVSNTRLLDTRKTTPGWRLLEKAAARTGGAATHRIGLFDALMIKSNHVAAVGDFRETVSRVMSGRGNRPVICEVRNESEIEDALLEGVPWLLLDHFTPERLQRAIRMIRSWDQRRRQKRKTVIEVSGNVTLRNIRTLARCGPDYISSGAITHSAPAVDFSLRWNE